MNKNAKRLNTIRANRSQQAKLNSVPADILNLMRLDKKTPNWGYNPTIKICHLISRHMEIMTAQYGEIYYCVFSFSHIELDGIYFESSFEKEVMLEFTANITRLYASLLTADHEPTNIDDVKQFVLNSMFARI